MGMDIFVYTQEPVKDLSEFVHLREWEAEGDGWVCKTKNWRVIVNSSQDLDSADVVPDREELLGIKPGIKYLTEINVEGRMTNEAGAIAGTTAQKVAYNGRGLVYEPSQDVLIVPRSAGPFASIPALEPQR